MKKLFLVLIFMCLAQFLYSQIYADYRYIPAKQELYTDLMYEVNDDLCIGMIHSEEKDFFNPYADDNTMTYIYFNIPIWNDNLRLQANYGFGFERDIEITIQYFIDFFYIEIGGSESEQLIIELNLNF